MDPPDMHRHSAGGGGEHMVIQLYSSGRIGDQETTPAPVDCPALGSSIAAGRPVREGSSAIILRVPGLLRVCTLDDPLRLLPDTVHHLLKSAVQNASHDMQHGTRVT